VSASRVASVAGLVVICVAFVSCGVQAHTVEVPVTRPTLFAPSDTSSAPTSAVSGPTTSSTTTKAPRPIPVLVADGKPRAVVTATGIVAAVNSVRADGAYLITSPCGAEVAVTKATPVVAANVVLDPGHGGVPDPGTVGPTGTKEATINLAVAQAAAAQLEAFGVKVVLTRTTDTYSTLASRARNEPCPERVRVDPPQRRARSRRRSAGHRGVLPGRRRAKLEAAGRTHL
jgi:hypothetical protein